MQEFLLDPSDPASIERHLRALGWIDESVQSAEKIGDGNMNLTVRVHLEHRTAILKQAHPWVEKYPSIPAPAGRALVEAAFYRAAQCHPGIASRMPALLGVDENSYLLFLEDLRDSADLMRLYQGDRLTPVQCDQLVAYLDQLHSLELDDPVFRNREMRLLNHAHQYEIPLRRDNGLDLDRITSGLTEVARDLQYDATYCRRAAELGRLYLADSSALVHGDYFPGSWLAMLDDIYVIDPEFCFLGCAEYDLGIFYAHLIFTRHEDAWPLIRSRYSRTADWSLTSAFAATELMRRLIGVAQLPLRASLEQKRAWLELSHTLLCG